MEIPISPNKLNKFNESDKIDKVDETNEWRSLVYGRKLSCALISYIGLEEMKKETDPNLDPNVPYYEKLEDIKDKVVITFTDVGIFGSPIFSGVSLFLKADFVKQYFSVNPIYYEDKSRNYHNCAWLMGPLFPFQDYKYVGTIYNDIYIGAILVNLIPKTKRSLYFWLQDDKNLEKSNDSESEQNTFKKNHNSVMWAFENEGHGVGAFVFYHENNEGEIDSVIVDNSYFEYPESVPNESFLLHQEKRIIDIIPIN